MRRLVVLSALVNAIKPINRVATTKLVLKSAENAMKVARPPIITSAAGGSAVRYADAARRTTEKSRHMYANPPLRAPGEPRLSLAKYDGRYSNSKYAAQIKNVDAIASASTLT